MEKKRKERRGEERKGFVGKTSHKFMPHPGKGNSLRDIRHVASIVWQKKVN